MKYSKEDISFANSLTEEQILDMMRDAVLMDEPIEVADGCFIHEPDGSCPHGFHSPLRVLGLI